MERKMARAAKRLPVAEQARSDSGKNEPAVPRPSRSSGSSARRSSGRPESGAHDASRPPGSPRRPPYAALAPAGRLRPAGNSRHEHRLGHRLHHHVPRAGRASLRVPARVDIFLRRGSHGPHHENSLGSDSSGRYHPRAASPLLVAHQPVSVHRAPARSGEKAPFDHSKVRSHVLAGVHGSARKQIARRKRHLRANVAALWALFVGSKALQLHSRAPLRQIPAEGAHKKKIDCLCALWVLLLTFYRSSAAKDPRATSRATASISGASDRSESTAGESPRTMSYALRVSGPVRSGASRSIPWQAASNSIARMFFRFASIGSSRRAPLMPIET